jgi:hypothetical protein
MLILILRFTLIFGVYNFNGSIIEAVCGNDQRLGLKT